MATAPFRIAVPRAVEVSAALEPVYNNLTSLALLNTAERQSTATTWVAQATGDGPENRRANRLVWIPEMVAALTAEERHRNRLVFEALGEALTTEQDWPDFAAYLDDLASQEPVVLRDRMFARMLRQLPSTVKASVLLADADAYIDAVETLYPDEPIDRELQIEAHTLLNDPAGMQQLIVTHLREMWSTRLADEWKHNSMLLARLVTMLRRRGLPVGSAAEVIRAFVGRDLPSNSSMLLAGVEQIIFVPSAHVGLYASKFGTENTLWVFVNTTVIMGWTLRQAPVGRPELLTRLSTLADETRLRILELLARHDELYAQEIMAQLDLTQSSASRHLNQLRSLGFIVERRGEGASKLYQLNRPQFDWTFRAIEQLLAGESVALDHLAQPDRPDEIRNFLDRNGRIESWPAKRKAQQVLLRYLVERFELGQRYSEREVNAVLNEWHTFDDPATLRRDMYDERLLDRTRDGMQYWRVTESTSS
jgi:hypothetical protein